MPYNSFHGCIIAAPDKHFFPAQIRSSRRGTINNLLPRHSITLPDYVTSCIFRNHSLITIERNWWHRRRRLKEYQINYSSSHHTLERSGTEICALETEINESSRLRVVQTDENDIVAVVCNANGVIEIVKLVPNVLPTKTPNDYR